MTDTNNAGYSLIFPPAEASTLTIELIQQRMTDPHSGVPTYIKSLDGYFNRMRPGELVTVLGRPSNYKSGLMQFIARNHALTLRDRGEKKCVIYVTWEQAIEEMTVMELAAATNDDASMLSQGKVRDHDALMTAAIKRSSLPLWLMGHSIKRRSRRPRLTMTDVESGLYYAEDEWGMKPDLIVLDYLQRIMPEQGRDIRTQNLYNVDRAKDLGLTMGCPVLLGCQVGRQVDDRKIKIPTLRDAAETSNVEQSSDGVITVWMPKMTEPLGSYMPSGIGMDDTIVTENLLIVSVPKRKLGRSGGVFALYVEPQKNLIREIKP